MTITTEKTWRRYVTAMLWCMHRSPTSCPLQHGRQDFLCVVVSGTEWCVVRIVQRTDVLMPGLTGKMRVVLFSPSGITPAQLAQLSVTLATAKGVTPLRTEDELRRHLHSHPRAIVISHGRPSVRAGMWFRVYRDHPSVIVLCIAPAFLPPDISMSGVLPGLKNLKTVMTPESLARMAHATVWLAARRKTAPVFQIKTLSAFIDEINSRTRARVMADKLPKHLKHMLCGFLAGFSREVTARTAGTGVRQVCLAESALKRRWHIPEAMTLMQGLLLDSSGIHDDSGDAT